MSKQELPPEPVRTFLLDHDYGKWKEYVNFLVDNFPQVQNGRVQYLIEGGAAIHLHMPNTRRDLFMKPHDIDVVCRSKELKNQFWPPITFDLKTVEEWFEFRSIKHTDERANILLSSSTSLVCGSREVLVLNKAALSLSKKLPFLGFRQRLKDTMDIKALEVPDEEIRTLRQKLNL